MGKKGLHAETEMDRKVFEQEYAGLRPLAEEFSLGLVGQLTKLIKDEGAVPTLSIQSRVKLLDRMIEKFARLSGRIKHVSDFQDLVGIRILLLFKRDVDRVCRIINENLEVIRSYDTRGRLQEDQFNYSSIHFIVKVPALWLALPTFKNMGDLSAEIQVRTFAQHVWAEASHQLQYTQEKNVPPSVLRSIYRVSALLETVDLEFERVLEERDSYRKLAQKSGSEQKLNVDLLEETLDQLLPSLNKSDDEEFGVLLDDLLYFDIETTGELRELINKNMAAVMIKEKQRLHEEQDAWKEDGYSMACDWDRLQSGVFFTFVGLVRAALGNEFGDQFEGYMMVHP